MSRSKYAVETPFQGPEARAAALWLAVALLLQVEVLPLLTVRHVPVSAVLVAVVWYALRVDMRRAALYGAIAGILEDTLATQTGGGWTIATTVTALFAGGLSRWFFADSIPLVALVVALATLLRNLVFWIVLWFEGYPSGLGRMHLHEALSQAVLDAAAMALVIVAARRYDARRHAR